MPNAAKAKLMDSSKEDLIRLITKQMSKIKKLEDGTGHEEHLNFLRVVSSIQFELSIESFFLF